MVFGLDLILNQFFKPISSNITDSVWIVMFIKSDQTCPMERMLRLHRLVVVLYVGIKLIFCLKFIDCNCMIVDIFTINNIILYVTVIEKFEDIEGRSAGEVSNADLSNVLKLKRELCTSQVCLLEFFFEVSKVK